MDPTWVIITGLGFDIAGAIFIVSPLLNYIRRIKDTEMGVKTSAYGPKKLGEYAYKKEWYIQRRVRIGLGLLIIGFSLQIVGNYFQNPPSF